MTEYIDKGIAINIIKMTDHTGYSIECVTDITDLAVKAIKEMPTADVVEVVRCKDCIHHKPFPFSDEHICDVFDWESEDKDFCSFAERRTHDN